MSENKPNQPGTENTSEELKYGAKITPDTQWRLAGNTLTGGDPGAILEQKRQEKKLAKEQEAKQKEMLKAPGFIANAPQTESKFVMPKLTGQEADGNGKMLFANQPGSTSPYGENSNPVNNLSNSDNNAGEPRCGYPSRRERPGQATEANSTQGVPGSDDAPNPYPQNPAQPVTASAPSYPTPTPYSQTYPAGVAYNSVPGSSQGAAATSYPSPAYNWHSQNPNTAPVMPGGNMPLPKRTGPVIAIILGIISALIIAPGITVGTLIYGLAKGVSEVASNPDKISNTLEVKAYTGVVGMVETSESTDKPVCEATIDGEKIKEEQIETSTEDRAITTYTYVTKKSGKMEFTCEVTDKDGNKTEPVRVGLIEVFQVSSMMVALLVSSVFGFGGIALVIGGIIWLVKRNKARRAMMFSNLYRL